MSLLIKEKDLAEAVKMVNTEINALRADLDRIAKTDSQSPIMVEGETKTGYYCQMMVDPKEAAKIVNDYDYAVYKVLGEDFPDEMWEALAEEYGLGTVTSIDL